LQVTADQALGTYKGTIIVMTTSGEVLALVSHPTFDPNRINDGKYWSNLTQDTGKPLLNRCMAGSYPLGSVMKIVDTLTLLEKKDNSKEYLCKGSYPVNERNKVNCTHPHGEVDLRRAFAVSCNGYFMKSMLTRASEKEFLSVAGLFFTKLPTDIKLLRDREFALAAIGQGSITVRPVEVLQLVNAIANGGFLVQPAFVSGETASVKKKVMDSAIALKLRSMMTDVVRSGTGKNLRGFISGERVLGVKTGTAQLTAGKKSKNVNWLVGFYGNSNSKPQYSFVVVLEDVKGFAAETAGPLISKVLMELDKIDGRVTSAETLSSESK